MGKAKRPSTGQVLSWILAPPRSVGAWSKSGKEGNIAKIIRRAGYGGIFTLLGRKHPRVGTTARMRGEGSRKWRAARGRLAAYGTLYPKQ